MQDLERLNDHFEPAENEGSNEPAVKEKKPFRGFSYKTNNLIEDQNGINALFKTFTMKPETVDGLRGMKRSEMNDLNKIIMQYKAWHLIHCPKLEYHFFLEKVQKMGKSQEFTAHLQKLRNHYKGEEMLEEFNEVFGEEAKVELQEPEAPVDQPKKDTKKRRVMFQLEESAGASQPAIAPESNPFMETDPNYDVVEPSISEAQLQQIEQNRQRALAKKRQREQMERQEALEQEELEEQLLDFQPSPKRQYKPEEEKQNDEEEDFLEVEGLEEFLDDEFQLASQDAVNFNKTMDE